MKDYYKILGVDKKVSVTEIKKTFRRRALLIHPDKSKTNTKDEFIELYEAYAILCDKKKRDRYDKLYDLSFNPIAAIKDEELKMDLKSISEKGHVYAEDFKQFEKEILGLILLSLFFSPNNLLLGALAAVFFGLWTILRGAINLDLGYTLVGCILTITGIFFGKLKIDEIKRTTR